MAAVTLRADEVRYDRTTSIADASGHVVMTDPEATLEGDAARIDMDDESGLDGGRATPTSPQRLRPDAPARLEKGIGPALRDRRRRVHDLPLRRRRDTPSWSIGGGRRPTSSWTASAWVHGATFRVKDVPVLWFPILQLPGQHRSADGLPDAAGRLLEPARLPVYEQPFFWAISKSQDATVALDVETAARIGILGEYRYMLSDERARQLRGRLLEREHPQPRRRRDVIVSDRGRRL